MNLKLEITSEPRRLVEVEADKPRPFDDSPTAWMGEGNCRDYPPATFFPSDGVGVEVAKRICATCPVAAQCLEYALDNHIDHGVWGGASERQRRRLLKGRRTAPLLTVV